MLTNEEMLEAIDLAKQTGHIDEQYRIDENDVVPCNSRCDTCPASETCLQLSEDKTYNKFVSNYNELIDGTLVNNASKSDKLLNLLDKMKSLGSDQELDHVKADALLVGTIKLLASNTIDKDISNKIIDVYENIPKWYS